jgi:hypothetical protein
MIRFVRQLLGAVVGVAAVALPAWGLFHLTRQGSCGDVGQPTCPNEVIGWVGALVGSFLVLGPLAVGLAGRDRVTGRSLLAAPIMLLMPAALVAGVVYSLVGPSADPDTHWIGWVILGLAGIIGVPVVLGVIGHRRDAPPPTKSQLPPHPAVAQTPAQMTSLAVTLGRVAQAGDEALSARLRRLDALRDSGAIDAEEHRRRRDEILNEI